MPGVFLAMRLLTGEHQYQVQQIIHCPICDVQSNGHPHVLHRVLGPNQEVSYFDWLRSLRCVHCRMNIRDDDWLGFSLPCIRHVVHWDCYNSAFNQHFAGHNIVNPIDCIRIRYSNCRTCHSRIRDVIGMTLTPFPNNIPIPVEQRTTAGINFNYGGLINKWSCCEYPLVEGGADDDQLNDIVILRPCWHPLHARCYFRSLLGENGEFQQVDCPICSVPSFGVQNVLHDIVHMWQLE